MGPPGPMPLATSATGLPVAYVAPKTIPVLTVRDGIVAEIPKGSDTYALASTGSVPVATPEARQPVKIKVAKASSKKKAVQQQTAQNGWQQNQPFGGWEQKRSGRYAMSGQQGFLSPFGTIR